MEQKKTISPKDNATKKVFELKNISTQTIVFVLLGIVAVILIINGNPMKLIDTTTSPGQKQVSPANEQVEELEQRLAAILSGIDGVGEVKVMVTMDSGKEIVPVLDKQATGMNNREQDAVDVSVKPVIVSYSTGGEPIVLKELEPAIRGVIVVAEGADDIGIRYNLEVAVMTVLGVDEGRVEIFNMKL